MWGKAGNVTFMDRILKDTKAEVADMQARFRDRANAITKSSMPPLEGVMRKKWIAQKEADYQDFLMVADCDIESTSNLRCHDAKVA